MAKPNLKPAGDPHRAELAAAITARDDAARVATAASTAVTRAREMVAQAEEKLAAATVALSAAKDAHSERMTQAATTGAEHAPDRSLRAARLGEADAQDDRDAAVASLAAVEAALPGPEHALRLAEERVAATADAVIASTSVALLLARAQAVQDDLVARRVVLRYMLRAGLVSGPEAEAVRRFLWAREQAIPGAPSLGPHSSSIEHVDWDKHDEAAAPWKAARELLLRDADAPLPE